jgi:hypothetical protein
MIKIVIESVLMNGVKINVVIGIKGIQIIGLKEVNLVIMVIVQVIKKQQVVNVHLITHKMKVKKNNLRHVLHY